MPCRAGEAEPIIDIRSSEVKFKVFVAPWTQLAWKPCLPSEPRIFELGCWDVASLVPAALQGRLFCVPVVPLLTLLRSCPLGLSAETYSPTDFLLDQEKPVSCQDFWGGTETTVYCPDVILSVCWPHLEHGVIFAFPRVGVWMGYGHGPGSLSKLFREVCQGIRRCT